MSLLHLEPQDSESSVGFSLEEYELLRQVRKEQARENCIWSTCPLVTTIMFNIAVDTNANSSFKLRQRSYTTIAAKLKTITDERVKVTNGGVLDLDDQTTAVNAVDTNDKSPSKADAAAKPTRLKLFIFDHSRPELPDTNTNEQAFQIQLFKIIRATKLFTGKKKMFVSIYSFASCIYEKNLCLRWGAMKRADNRGSTLKIRIHVPPTTIAQLKQQGAATSTMSNVDPTATTEPDTPLTQVKIVPAIPPLTAAKQ